MIHNDITIPDWSFSHYSNSYADFYPKRWNLQTWVKSWLGVDSRLLFPDEDCKVTEQPEPTRAHSEHNGEHNGVSTVLSDWSSQPGRDRQLWRDFWWLTANCYWPCKGNKKSSVLSSGCFNARWWWWCCVHFLQSHGQSSQRSPHAPVVLEVVVDAMSPGYNGSQLLSLIFSVSRYISVARRQRL